jgi:class 3 adenylate cyclase
MFCDLVGSTELATKLDPEPLRDLMQTYQRTCGDVIERYEGHVAQYLGDGLMIYFGWPTAHEDDAVRAVRAGLEITQAVSQLDAERPLRTRVGIHTGLVVVGETGHGDASIPKAAVGETPNIAARLQGLANPGGVVVSGRTRGLAGGLFEYSDLGAQQLKGLTDPLQVFGVVGSRAIESRFEAARGDLLLTPLVGREEEIALVLRRWQQAKEGEGQVVLVGGEPGIGKSRLTRVLRDRLSQDRYTVLRYQCSPYHVNSALYPIIEQLERASGFTREDSPEQRLDKLQAVLVGAEAELAESTPLLASLLSLPVDRYAPLNLSPQKQKGKTLEALAGQVEALAQRQPVLMIWEDVHWIDATSQESLDLLVPRLHGLPVLLVVTYRPEYSPKWAEQAHVTLLGLTRLGRRQAAELVAKITGGKPLPPEVLNQIVAHTDGVPLFVEELTKSILESKLVRAEDNRYVLDGPLPALAIPTNLRDSLIARLDRLAPIREVAQIGACIGREFSYRLLSAVSPLKGSNLEGALEQLSTSGLVFKRGTAPDATYTFKHALVQDAAYDSLLKSKRAQLHAQIAQALEAEFPETAQVEPELLAHHYTEAGLVTRAIPYWTQAGKYALERMTLTEAIAHLAKALEVIKCLAPSRQRDEFELDARLALGTAWSALQGWQSSDMAKALTPVPELARVLGRLDALASALRGLWVFEEMTRPAVSVSRAQQMLDAGIEAGNRDLILAGYTCLMANAHWAGDISGGLRSAAKVLELYDPEIDRRYAEQFNHDPITLKGNYEQHWYWILGYPEKALRACMEMEEHARRINHPFDLCFALTAGANVFDYRWEAEALLKRTREALRISREKGLPLFSEIMCGAYEGVALLRAGRAAESIPLLQENLARWHATGAKIWGPYIRLGLAEALASVGNLDEAFSVIDATIKDVDLPEWNEKTQYAEMLRIRGRIRSLEDDMAGAERDYLASLAFARAQEAKSWELRTSTSLARLWRNQGKQREALGLLKPIYDWFTEGFDTKDLREAKALLESLQ